jgi:hypothetical protein
MRRGNYLGMSFDVWSRQEGWFWLVRDSRHEAGAIGATAREADAVREACLSIEQMTSNIPVARKQSESTMKRPIMSPPLII